LPSVVVLVLFFMPLTAPPVSLPRSVQVTIEPSPGRGVAMIAARTIFLATLIGRGEFLGRGIEQQV
jgi:hypothetical protein